MADANPQHTAHVVVEEPRTSLFSNIVAIVGLIILIVIVIWGLVHLTSLSKGWFSSLFNRTPAAVTVTAPQDATSSVPFTVSWKYSTSEKGNYAFLYQCRAGLTLKANTTALPCGAAFTVGETTSLSLTPTFAGVASTTLPISVIFLPSSTTSAQAQGSASITIHSGFAPAPVSETATVTTPIQAVSVTHKPAIKPTNVYQGPADLAVRMIAIGIIDPYSGQFINRAPGPNDMAAAQFDISNVGGSTSGTYYFSANLPTISGYSYVSPAQSPLAPGSHVINTLRWSEPNPAGGTFSVSLSGGKDSNGGNNYASQWIGSNYNQYQYQYAPQPVYYPQYTY